ncbi:MAG: hypothetical protein WAX89_01190 [Alphaproteobacteria bacterium]
MPVLFDWSGSMYPNGPLPPNFENKHAYGENVVNGVLNLQRNSGFQADVPPQCPGVVLVHMTHALLGEQPLDPSKQLQNTLKDFLLVTTQMKVVTVGDGTFAIFARNANDWEKLILAYQFFGTLRTFYVSLLRKRQDA